MAKSNKVKKGAQNNSGKVFTGADSSGGLKGGLNAVANMISSTGDASVGILGDTLKKSQVAHDASSEDARKLAETTLSDSLQDLVGLLKAEISSANTEKSDYLSRASNLEQGEAFVSTRKEELDALKKEIELEKKDMSSDKKDMASKKSDIADKSRDLENRLLDAEAGFADKNTELLKKFSEAKEIENKRFEEQKAGLLSDISVLEDESSSVKQKIETESAEILRSLNKKKKELDSREDELKEGQNKLDIQLRRLLRQERQLDESQNDMKEDVRKEYLRDIERAKSTEQDLIQQITQFTIDELGYKKQLASYSSIKDQLGGDGPQVLLNSLKALRERNDKLSEELLLKPSADLEEKFKNLRAENQNLLSQLDTKTFDLSTMQTKVSLSRIGVIEKESLSKEKLVLEKHNEILGGRIESLRDEVDDLLSKQESKTAFPALMAMDKDDQHNRTATTENVTSLVDFVSEMQQRIAWDKDSNKELFFRLEDIRLFVAGLSMSRLHILQGISGTGKTSLAKAFSRAVGGGCTTVSVQAGWRDKDDLLGHYNSFEKQFYERPCLQGLYEAQTPFYEDRPYIVLLDEMNLSRPEQYFAEFLSTLELDHKDQLLTLMTSSHTGAPRSFIDGRQLQIPGNVWFIGTANHDETTFEFADKTYDRAHVIELPRNESRFDIDKSLAPLSYSYSSLEKAFSAAEKKHSKEITELFDEINHSDFVDILGERLGVGWGNRLERQGQRFISTMLASGAKKGEALDHLFATKVLRSGKATGRYDTEKGDIEKLSSELKALWRDLGIKDDPTASNKLLSDELRRKSNH
jgi:hypothetical protein